MWFLMNNDQQQGYDEGLLPAEIYVVTRIASIYIRLSAGQPLLSQAAAHVGIFLVI